MRRFLIAGLAALLLWISPLRAQAPTPAPQNQQSGAGESQVSALPYAAALIFTLAILVVVCMPSRKG